MRELCASSQCYHASYRLSASLSKEPLFLLFHISGYLYVIRGSDQVTELKGLATHMLVGSVICETKDLFTAMPQVVAVDVNDLGTIKLNLEVTW